MTSSPMYFPATFDLKEAIFLNQLVVTAYDMYSQWERQGQPEKEKFNWIPNGPKLQYSEPIWGEDRILRIFKKAEPFAFIASSEDKKTYLVFRGTESPADWSENTKLEQTSYSLAPGYGKVHHGFFSIYETMSSTIRALLGAIPDIERLYITGHSLGSSLSTLSVPDIITNTKYSANLPVTHYNLASPRTGDPDFADAYNANGVVTYRVVNTCDLVPTVPLSVTSISVTSSILPLSLPIYKHVGVPVDFTAQYNSIVSNHGCSDSYLYALEHPEQPEKPNQG